MSAGGAMSLGTLGVRLKLDASEFQRVLAAAKGKLEGAAQGLNNAAAQMTRVGLKMTLAVTTPLTLFARRAVNSFGAFDKAMAETMTILPGVSAEMRAEMEKTAQTISSRSVTSAVELAEGYKALASAGLTAEQSIKTLGVVERFSVAGAFNLGSATNYLTNAQAAMGLTSADAGEHMKQMARIADAMAMAANQSEAEVVDFAKAMTNDAAAGAVELGQDLETTMAVLDAFAKKGKKGDEAGSLLGRGFRLLASAERENSQEWAKRGVAVVDAKTGRYRNVIDIIASMEKAFSGMTEPQRNAELAMMGFQTMTLKAVTPLLGMSQQMRVWRGELDQAGGTVDRMANEQMKAFSNQMTVFWNNVQNVGIAVGRILAPYLLKLNAIITQGLQWWESLSPTIKEVTVWLGIAAAAIGPVLLLLGSLVGALASVVTAIGGAALVLPALTAALPTIAVVVAALIAMLPLLAVGLLITAHATWTLYRAGAAFVEWLGPKFSDTLTAMGEALKAGEFRLAVDIFWAYVKMQFLEGVQWIADQFSFIYTAITSVFSGIAAFARATFAVVKAEVQPLIDLAKAGQKSASAMWRGAVWLGKKVAGPLGLVGKAATGAGVGALEAAMPTAPGLKMPQVGGLDAARKQYEALTAGARLKRTVAELGGFSMEEHGDMLQPRVQPPEATPGVGPAAERGFTVRGAFLASQLQGAVGGDDAKKVQEKQLDTQEEIAANTKKLADQFGLNSGTVMLA